MKKNPRVAKAPRSHIVKNSNSETFLNEVNEFFEKGFRPIQDMRVFAEYDQKSQEWQTLFVMPLVHFEELKAFQTVPTGDDDEPERMFS
jgi:hypothetical protein